MCMCGTYVVCTYVYVWYICGMYVCVCVVRMWYVVCGMWYVRMYVCSGVLQGRTIPVSSSHQWMCLGCHAVFVTTIMRHTLNTYVCHTFKRLLDGIWDTTTLGMLTVAPFTRTSYFGLTIRYGPHPIPTMRIFMCTMQLSCEHSSNLI